MHLLHSYLHVHIHELLIKKGPSILLHFSVFKGRFHCTFYQLQPHLFQQLQRDRHSHSSPAGFLLYLYCTLYQLQQCFDPSPAVFCCYICTAHYISFSSVLIPYPLVCCICTAHYISFSSVLIPHLLVFCICTAHYISFSSILIPHLLVFFLYLYCTLHQLQWCDRCSDPSPAGFFFCICTAHYISFSGVIDVLIPHLLVFLLYLYCTLHQLQWCDRCSDPSPAGVFFVFVLHTTSASVV